MPSVREEFANRAKVFWLTAKLEDEPPTKEFLDQQIEIFITDIINVFKGHTEKKEVLVPYDYDDGLMQIPDGLMQIPVVVCDEALTAELDKI